MDQKIYIGDRPIGRDHPPFIVAEMSGNHNRSLERALRIVEAAADAGAHALKLQTYTPDTMTVNERGDGFRIGGDSRWKGKSFYELYGEAYTPWEWHSTIYERARQLGLIVFSSPFDETAVDFLEALDSPAYKIASFELVDLPLIHKVASTRKPLIISTGMARLREIDEAVNVAREAGCKDLIILKCTSSYPTDPRASNIRTIANLRESFGVEVGISDHTLGIGVAVAAVALGATVIEKHFTLSRADGGVDAAFSLEPEEMRQLGVEAERAWQALGTVVYGPTGEEKASLGFRRSLYITKDIKAGDILTKENIRAIRPGYGLEPKYYDTVLGMQVNADVERGTPLSWDLVRRTGKPRKG